MARKPVLRRDRGLIPSGPVTRFVLGLCLAAPWAAPASAQPAEAPVLVVLVGPGAPDARRRTAWRERVASAAPARVADPADHARARLAPPLPRSRVRSLREVERRIVAARRDAAALREAAALRSLAGAARIAEDAADVPGAAGWIAEVHTALAVTAAQAGHVGLASASLTRAALLDPGRGLRAAEAPPELVARAAEIARGVASRPAGELVVRVDAPGARVFLDDAPLGEAPATLRAPVGQHVLRITAPGHVTYGRPFDVLEGRRADVTVHLSPTPELTAARALADDARRYDLREVRATLAALAAAGVELSVWMVDVGDGPRDRATLTPCASDGCRSVIRLEAGEPIAAPSSGPEPPLDEVFAARRSALAWLDEPAPPPPPPPPPTPWWRRPHVWIAWAAIVGGALAGAILTARPEPERRLDTTVIFDPELYPRRP